MDTTLRTARWMEAFQPESMTCGTAFCRLVPETTRPVLVAITPSQPHGLPGQDRVGLLWMCSQWGLTDLRGHFPVLSFIRNNKVQREVL